MEEYTIYTDTLNKINEDDSLLNNAQNSVKNMHIYDDLGYQPQRNKEGKITFSDYFNIKDQCMVVQFPVREMPSSFCIRTVLPECYMERDILDQLFLYHDAMNSPWNSHRMIVLSDICILKDKDYQLMNYQYLDVILAGYINVVMNDYMNALPVVLEKRLEKAMIIAAGYDKDVLVLNPFEIIKGYNPNSYDTLVQVLLRLLPKYRYCFDEIVLVNDNERYKPYFERIQREFKNEEQFSDEQTLFLRPAYFIDKQEYLINKIDFVIGKGRKDDLKIHNRALKQGDLEIHYYKEQYYATSHNSSIQLNNKEIMVDTKLNDQDVFTIGGKQYLFKITENESIDLKTLIEQYNTHKNSTNYSALLEAIKKTPLVFPVSKKIEGDLYKALKNALLVYEEGKDVILPGYTTVRDLKKELDEDFVLVHPDVYLPLMAGSDATALMINDQYTVTKEEVRRMLEQ